MALVEQRDAEVPVVGACAAVGLSRATLYRCRRPSAPSPSPSRPRAPNPRRLTDEERQRILDTLHLPELADQPPSEVYATLLGRGDYIGSIRTIYRVLADAGEVRERRNVRAAQVHPTPSLVATAPNQVWTWDITKLATTEKGIFLQAYVIIDLFSRFVVGWLLAAKECKHLAATMFAEAIARHGVAPGLIVHADRGSAMKSDTLAQLLADLGASRSFSRPRVSDDNAFSEAQFKTMKYQSDYPGQFTGVLHGCAWLQGFFGWHNEDHHHSGLALFTPAEVFHGRVEEVARVRQVALDAAYAAHPERFPNGAPTVRRPPAEVAINPVSPEKAAPEVEGRNDTLAIGTGDAPTTALDAAHAAHPKRFPNGAPTVRRPPAEVAINPVSPEKAAPEVEGRNNTLAIATGDVDAPATALDAAYASHPERFPNGAPTVRRPPAEVGINPVSPEKAAPEVEGRNDTLAIGTSDVDGPATKHLPARPSTGGAEPHGATPSPLDTRSCRAEPEQPPAALAIAS